MIGIFLCNFLLLSFNVYAHCSTASSTSLHIKLHYNIHIQLRKNSMYIVHSVFLSFFFISLRQFSINPSIIACIHFVWFYFFPHFFAPIFMISKTINFPWMNLTLYFTDIHNISNDSAANHPSIQFLIPSAVAARRVKREYYVYLSISLFWFLRSCFAVNSIQ